MKELRVFGLTLQRVGGAVSQYVAKARSRSGAEFPNRNGV
jgi:hypothetical protein